MYPNNETASRKRTTVITIVVLFVIVGMALAVIYVLQSQRDRHDAIRPASLVVSCHTDTPEQDLPKSIKQGDSGSCVATIRELLESHGIAADSSATGQLFDESLTALVKRFQADHQLRQDGVVGEQTWTALRNTPRSAQQPSESPLPSDEPTEPTKPTTDQSTEPDATKPVPSDIEPLPLPETTAPPIIEQPIQTATPLPPESLELPEEPKLSPKPKPKPQPSPSPTPDTQPPFELSAKQYDRFTGPNTTDSIVLTYDDCPRSYDSFVATLQTAKELGVSLVLAPTATCVDNHLFDVQHARDLGHVVINHSIDHRSYLDLTPTAIKAQIRHDRFDANFARPPFGAGGFNESTSSKVVTAFADTSTRMWLWSVDTEDWGGNVDGKNQPPKSTTAIVKHIEQHTQPGDTVLMHMQHNGFSPEALTTIVDTLHKHHLTVCKNANKPMTPYPTASMMCR